MFGYSVKDAVITVPEFATAHERQALLDAADVAGLTVLSLMDENTAAALQHAISQTYEEDTNVMFYNMGANSIQVTIVTFGPKKIKDRNVGKLTVRGKGWDATVGGWWFDLKLTDVFAEGFNAKVTRRDYLFLIVSSCGVSACLSTSSSRQRSYFVVASSSQQRFSLHYLHRRERAVI